MHLMMNAEQKSDFQLTSSVRNLRTTMDASNAYAKIAQKALYLGEQECLAELRKLIPQLTGVTTEAQTEDDEGKVRTFLESFKLHLGGSTVELWNVDVDDFFASDDLSQHEDVATMMCLDIDVTIDVDDFDLPEYSEEQVEQIKLMYQLLNDLPRIAGIKGGEMTYVLRAESAYTGSVAWQHPLLARRNTYVVFSKAESDASGDGAGYWSNDFGWTTLDCATQFTASQAKTLDLPNIGIPDARYVRRIEAEAETLFPSEIPLEPAATPAFDGDASTVSILPAALGATGSLHIGSLKDFDVYAVRADCPFRGPKTLGVFFDASDAVALARSVHPGYAGVTDSVMAQELDFFALVDTPATD